jgi:hypothetical protein
MNAMTDATAEEYFPHDTFHAQWFLFWVIAVASGVLVWLSFFRPTPVTAPPRAAISAGYDWFLVLHMPEVPKDPAKAADLQQRFGGWLEALNKEGYHPMLLSDIQNRLDHAARLPERAIVLVFDPAYFHTYEALAPILVQYRFPAFWVTDHTAILRGDRHFIHRHQAKWMVQSGFWDLGYTGDGFWRRASDSSDITINQSHKAAWVRDTGHTALNWGSGLPFLNRLDVSSKWTPEELITRLEMELPLQSTVHLGVKRIQGRLWGVVMPSSEKKNQFSFQSPLAATASNLYWFGTRGASDVQLDVDIPSFFGEVSLWLRSDNPSGQGIGIGFTHRQLYVDQKWEGRRNRLVLVPWTPPSGAIKGRITLIGTNLHLAIEGAKPLNAVLAPETPSPHGFVRLELFDRIRGAARAEFVGLVLTSLTKPPH